MRTGSFLNKTDVLLESLPKPALSNDWIFLTYTCLDYWNIMCCHSCGRNIHRKKVIEAYVWGMFAGKEKVFEHSKPSWKAVSWQSSWMHAWAWVMGLKKVRAQRSMFSWQLTLFSNHLHLRVANLQTSRVVVKEGKDQQRNSCTTRKNRATSSTSMILNKWHWSDAEICLLQLMASGRSGPSGQNATPAVEEAPDNAAGLAQDPSSVGRNALAKSSKLRPVTHRTVPVSWFLLNLLVSFSSILSIRFKSAVPNDWLAIYRP